MERYVAQLQAECAALTERLRSHSFLVRCREGNVTLEELKVFLVQQGLYATNFTKYLCAAMANLPGNEEIRPLSQNLFDECGFSGTKPHAVVYDEMLETFGLALKGAAPLPGTVKLISAMFRHCRNENGAHGVGALGLGAEMLVPALYTDIVTGFEHCGVDRDRLVFFTLHITVDETHGDALRDIMVSMLQRHPENLALMVAAGKDLVEARRDFFTSIEETAKPVSAAV